MIIRHAGKNAGSIKIGPTGPIYLGDDLEVRDRLDWILEYGVTALHHNEKSAVIVEAPVGIDDPNYEIALAECLRKEGFELTFEEEEEALDKEFLELTDPYKTEDNTTLLIKKWPELTPLEKGLLVVVLHKGKSL